MALVGVAAAQVTIDLTPTSIFASVDSDGFSPTNVEEDLKPNSWVGTWENTSLENQVSAGADGLSLQIGAAASTVGNYAAVKFEAETPLTLSFDIKRTNFWGQDIASFTCEYTCTVYGFESDGSSSVIGTWSDNIVGSSMSTTTYDKSPDITLEKGDYASYGIIFRSMETSSLGGGAGVAMNISNIRVTAENLVPEPTTATLSLLALAGLAAHRRRK